MSKVSLKPESTKSEHHPLFCFICNGQLNTESEEYRKWFRYQFCSICCMDSFKARFN